MITIVGILTIFNGSVFHTLAQDNAKICSYEFAADPLNATCSIKGHTIRLQVGRSALATMPHPAITKKTAM